MCSSDLLPIHIAPGLIFGVVFGFLLQRQRSLGIGSLLAYVAAATFANAVAVEAAIGIDEFLPAEMADFARMALAGAVGGALGGGLLAAASIALLGASRRQLPRVTGLLALTGAILGALLLPVTDVSQSDTSETLAIFVLYIVWQAGYAAVSQRLLWSSDAKMTAPRLG